MYIRHKKRPDNSTAIQIVSGSKQKGKVVQKVLRHVGIAKNEHEIEIFEQMAHRIKINMEYEIQPTLFSPEELVEMVLKAREKQRQRREEEELKVNLKKLKEEQRVILGIHEVYGKLYKQLDFDQVLTSKATNEQEVLKNIVMARLATPTSKRGAVAMLARDFGVKIELHKVYRMMDHIDQQAIERIQDRAYQMTTKLTEGKVKVVLYDCTTLYFESFQPDELKQNGFSKDGKHNQPQVLLALMVNENGLPIGYEIFPGATFEGHTLIPALEKLKEKYKLEKLVVVADSGLLSQENCQRLAEQGYYYVLGARLRNLPIDLQASLLDTDNYHKIDNKQQGKKPREEDDPQRIGDFNYDHRRLVVHYSAKRARKDAHEREKSIDKLQKRLAKNKSTKAFLGNSGYKKFLDLSQQSIVSVNKEKVAAEARWDGLCGIVTNLKDEAAKTLISQYRRLWQIEACFRVQKHDLKIRPIFHWTPQRIKAHIAICFIAFTAQSYLTYHLKHHGLDISLEQLRNSLLHVQASILRDQQSNRWYALPSCYDQTSYSVYKLLKIPLTTTPCEITQEVRAHNAIANAVRRCA